MMSPIGVLMHVVLVLKVGGIRRPPDFRPSLKPQTQGKNAWRRRHIGQNHRFWHSRFSFSPPQVKTHLNRIFLHKAVFTWDTALEISRSNPVFICNFNHRNYGCRLKAVPLEVFTIKHSCWLIRRNFKWKTRTSATKQILRTGEVHSTFNWACRPSFLIFFLSSRIQSINPSQSPPTWNPPIHQIQRDCPQWPQWISSDRHWYRSK
jgi:hypothetical protein